MNMVNKTKIVQFWKDFANMLGWTLVEDRADDVRAMFYVEYNNLVYLPMKAAKDIVKASRGNHLVNCDFNCSCGYADVPKDDKKCSICHKKGHTRLHCPDQMKIGETE